MIGYSDDKKIKHLKSSKYLLNSRLDRLLALFFVGEEEELIKGILNGLMIGYSDDKKIKHLKSSKYLLNSRLDRLLALFFVGEEEELI